MTLAVHGPQKPRQQAVLANDASLPDEPLFEDCHLAQTADWPNYDAEETWRIDGCALDHCSLSELRLHKLTMWDSTCAQTDMSAARPFGAGVLRCTFQGCRLTGTQFGESQLKDVCFTNCKLNMLSLRSAHLQRVRFVSCTLEDADFNSATLIDVTFEDCILTRTDFSAAKLTRVDLRGNDISELRGVASLHGAIIAPEQLAQLAPILCNGLGIIVAE